MTIVPQSAAGEIMIWVMITRNIIIQDMKKKMMVMICSQILGKEIRFVIYFTAQFLSMFLIFTKCILELRCVVFWGMGGRHTSQVCCYFLFFFLCNIDLLIFVFTSACLSLSLFFMSVCPLLVFYSLFFFLFVALIFFVKV